MVAVKIPIMERDYLVLEAAAETRHEFVGGEILAMAGSEYAHNLICHNLHVELGKALGDRRCSVLGADQRVKVESRKEYLYPDVTVSCLEPKLVPPGPPAEGPKGCPWPASLVNPQVIIEVLSPSTERYDRVDKWFTYQQIPTLTDYVMVASDRMLVEHQQRGPGDSWIYRKLSRDDVLSLSNGVTLPVLALYRMVPELEV